METSYKYEIRLADQSGNEIKTLVSFNNLKLARVVSDVGNLELKIPSWDDYDNFKPDSRIGVYRSVAGEPPKLIGETIWIVTGRKRIRRKRQKYLVVYASDANLILQRRIIAYQAGTAEAVQTNQVTDLLTHIVRDNLGSDATDTSRTVSVISLAGFTTLGPIISKSFPYKNLLTTLQEICQSSYSSGTYLAFDLVALDLNNFQFRSYPNVRGVDRRYESAVQPVVIDADLNLGDFELFEDYSNNANVIYAAGQGESTARELVTLVDSSRNYSNIGRVEKFVDARNNSTTALVTAEALSALRNYRPKRSFVAEFIQSEDMLFGRDINFGDYLPVQVENLVLDCRIDAFALELDESGLETVKIVLRADE
jgi:hypothetical protein